MVHCVSVSARPDLPSIESGDRFAYRKVCVTISLEMTISSEKKEAIVSSGPMALMSRSVSGRAKTEATEMAFRLNPDSIVHALLLATELVKDESILFDSVRRYTRDFSNASSKLD